MAQAEIDNKHRIRAREIVESAQHLAASEDELVELIAEGYQATENNALKLTSVRIDNVYKRISEQEVKELWYNNTHRKEQDDQEAAMSPVRS